jgi:hypothetical protein
MASIHAALEEFLDEQRIRLSERSFRNYERVILYLKKHAIREGFDDLRDREVQQLYDKVIQKGREEDVEAFFKAVEAKQILGHFGLFLSYFMPRKVIDSKAVERAAAPTLRKLTGFLADRGYIDKEAAEYAVVKIENAVMT